MAGGTAASGAQPPLRVSIDISVEGDGWADVGTLAVLAGRAVDAAVFELGAHGSQTELSLLFTSDEAIRVLNAQWREKDKPTNVLSFPAFPEAAPDHVPPMLGDIVFARETVEREAALDGKAFDHHLTHLVVHGFLHLLGYDHEDDDEAEEMEEMERRILARLAIADPYAVSGDD